MRRYYFTTRDLVTMAILTALQTVVSISAEPLIRGLIHGVLHLPGPGTGQAIFGGILTLFWMLLAYGLTLKRGAAALTSILMGITHLFYGIGPLTGFLAFFVYLITAPFLEIGLILKPTTLKYIVTGAMGNTIFFLAFIAFMGFYQGRWLLVTFIPIAIGLGILSGAFLGGLTTLIVLRNLQRAGLAPREA
ncbi:hypothetical protein KEJ36_04990 [Candidatus Bathyarchaeota archaeon]|nr:hypothetical protein [Candidatus Bathyarchaeota archaeon]MBS7628139.1 hypothetical protein [Candidatus Bathyarchaeota archaeon]